MTQTFENLFLRKAVPADTTCIMQMITDAKKQMQREGKQQWQGAYPALSDITTDITSKQGYVLCDGYTAVAYGAVVFGTDPTYRVIDGQWLNEDPYAVIHRLAVSEAYKHRGIATCFFEQVEKLALLHGISNIRVDTNFDNEYMQRLLARRNYRYCGEIQNPNGQRQAYQKTLSVPSSPAYWFLFNNGQILLEKISENIWSVPCSPLPPVQLSGESDVHILPDLDGLTCYTCHLPYSSETNVNYRLTNLRASYDYLPAAQYRRAGHAAQQLYWDDNSRFCPVCGNQTIHQERIMKKCPVCGKELYPPISTAIMVLVRKDDQILMVRSHTFKGNYYGLIAGFLEPGETLEECVIREVYEETRLSIKNLKYFRSQSWPYPSGLMVGYVADYAGGELQLQKEELCAGGFFGKDNLPDIPKKLSLARQLIDWWLAQQTQ